MLALGVFMIVAGTIGLLVSNLLTLTSILIFGGLIFAGGILQIVQGVQAREKDWIGRLQHFFIAILYLIGGLIITWDPLAASLVLTIILASLFAVIGVIKISYAIYCKRRQWRNRDGYYPLFRAC